MKVFISWSEEQSHSFAKSLHEWLPLVLHYVEPWLSKSDIDAGERWGIKIAKELEVTNFGIICVTKENANSPWILFEAGALAKSMEDGRVIPLLLDIDFKEISGPLAQFQAKKSEKSGIEDVITAINKAAPNPVPEARLKQLFDSLWPGMESQIASIPKKSSSNKTARSENDILEELVSSVRGLEVRLRDGDEQHPAAHKKRKNRINPEMVMDMMHRIGEGPNDPIQLLAISSLLREDAPWIYELGMESYRAVKSGDKIAAKKAHSKFLHAMDIFIHSPLAEEFSDKRMFYFLREMLPVLDHNIMRAIKGDKAA